MLKIITRFVTMNPTEQVFSKDKTENKILAFDETSKLVKPTNEDKTFGDDDFWSFYNGGGYCDGPNEGSLTTFGAPEKIASHVNFYAFGGWKQRLVGYYYTDIEVVGINGPYGSDLGFSDEYINPNDLIPNDNYLDFYIYKSYGNNNTLCLSPDEMNFYASVGIPFIINENSPTNKSFLSVGLINDLIVGVSGLFWHNAEIRYGIKHEQLSQLEDWNP